jgi:hypothetical protein
MNIPAGEILQQEKRDAAKSSITVTGMKEETVQ